MQIEAKQISFTYMKGSPFEKKAINDVSLTIPSGSYSAIIGHTGSGKSTFIQHMNGLLKPTVGEMTVGKWAVKPDTKQKALYDLRQHVGIVFQFPEHQLFAETVLDDVAYGPDNFGFTKNEAREKAMEALTLVGLDETFYDRSPFELSGGQMRRVAIAGVLATDPDILILDEPTAGLDPNGQKEMMELFHHWYKTKEERSVVLVTHHMEDAARYAETVFVMDKGSLVMEGSPTKVFSKKDELTRLGLSVPQTVSLLSRLKEKAKAEQMDIAKFDLKATVDEICLFMRKGD